jgi:ribosomal protein S18 acetylase RimI-like enzyme
VQLHFIDVNDPLYQHELELRFRVLREPLGMTRNDVQFPFERECLHVVAVEAQGHTVLGCVMFHAESASSGRLLQMAVDPLGQGRGLGRTLVVTLEHELVRRGVREVHLHARESALPFYERLGYAAYGEPYLEVGLAHRMARKTLPASR